MFINLSKYNLAAPHLKQRKSERTLVASRRETGFSDVKLHYWFYRETDVKRIVVKWRVTLLCYRLK